MKRHPPRYRPQRTSHAPMIAVGAFVCIIACAVLYWFAVVKPETERQEREAYIQRAEESVRRAQAERARVEAQNADLLLGGRFARSLGFQ